MPTIENHSERPYEFTGRPRSEGAAFIPANPADSIKIPRIQVRKLPDDKEERTPGTVKVSPEKLAEMQKDDVAKHWFTPLTLVVVPDKGAEKSKS